MHKWCFLFMRKIALIKILSFKPDKSFLNLNNNSTFRHRFGANCVSIVYLSSML